MPVLRKGDTATIENAGEYIRGQFNERELKGRRVFYQGVFVGRVTGFDGFKLFIDVENYATVESKTGFYHIE